jgi:hypothetical protein
VAQVVEPLSGKSEVTSSNCGTAKKKKEKEGKFKNVQTVKQKCLKAGI